MRDFLDNLIDRHVDAAPQIVPRLPSIFEPEVSHGGLDASAPDSDASEIEETVSGGSPVRRKEIALSHAAAAAPPPAAPTVVEPMQPVFSLSPRERAGVRGVNSTSDPLTLTLSQRERGINEGFPESSATLIAPVMGRVRHAHQEESTERAPSNPKATAENQSPIKGLDKPAFSLSPRERAGVREVNSTSDPLTLTLSQGVRGLNHGLLKPAATLIAPVTPSVVGAERPVSQPEPIINVTIGRIEVRATMSPQKQAHKPESRTPVMGLDEYLHRRSGGHDR